MDNENSNMLSKEDLDIIIESLEVFRLGLMDIKNKINKNNIAPNMGVVYPINRLINVLEGTQKDLCYEAYLAKPNKLSHTLSISPQKLNKALHELETLSKKDS